MGAFTDVSGQPLVSFDNSKEFGLSGRFIKSASFAAPCLSLSHTHTLHERQTDYSTSISVAPGSNSATPPRRPRLRPRGNMYSPPLVFLAQQRKSRSAIRGFHLYSDKGYLGNLVPAISHYGESYEAEIKFSSRRLCGEGR